MLQAIFASTPVGLQIYGRDGRTVLVNQAHADLFGLPPPPEFNIFEDSILIERGVAELVRRGFAGERITIPPIWYDIRELRNVAPELDRSGGRRIAIGAELVPLRNAGGEVDFVLFVFHDATAAHEAREQAEAAAAAAEHRAVQSAFLAEASRLLASSLDFEATLAQVARLATPTLADFCLVDLLEPSGTIRRVAAAHADPAGQPLIDQLRERFPPRANSLQPAARVIITGAPELLVEVDADVIASHTMTPEHRDLITRLGIKSHLAVPLLLGQRTLGAISLGYVGDRRYTAEDVPLVEALASRAAVAIENARLYRAADAARAEAEAANRSKDEFLAMLGHELRNPLAPIVTALELIQMREGPSRERSVIERQVEHVCRLVDDLLDVSRIARNGLDLDRRPLELAEAVLEGVAAAQPLITQRRHELVLELPPGLCVFGDRVRLTQVVSNLLTNAARYTEQGGTITVAAERAGAEVVLRVRDTGVGIPPELLPRVFDVFTRGGRASDRSWGGLGLGLAIVRALVELHDGRVCARSEGLGRGSELEVVLPALDSAPIASPTATSAAARPAPAPIAGIILLVDDHVEAAELLAEALTERGCRCIVAHDPHQALSLARAKVPAAAIVDLGMPEIDGYELARRLHAERGLEQLPILALTGFGQPGDQERSHAAGFAGHLVKPVHVEAVMRALAALVRPS